MNAMGDTSSLKNTVKDNQFFIPTPAAQLRPSDLMTHNINGSQSQISLMVSNYSHMPVIFPTVANILFLKIYL